MVLKREKRIFSINLISFLKLQNFNEVNRGIAEDTGKVYYVFPENDEVKEKINEYKGRNVTVNLHDFISQFRGIKQNMRELREQK